VSAPDFDEQKQILDILDEDDVAANEGAPSKEKLFY
jgi:hypothetical protein